MWYYWVLLTLALLSCRADFADTCQISEDRLVRAEVLLRGALCNQEPFWAVQVKRALERDMVAWDSDIFYMVFEKCGFAATALRVALRIIEFPVTSHIVLGMFGWVDSLKWKQVLLSRERPLRSLAAPMNSNWVPLTLALYTALCDLWAHHIPQEAQTSTLAAELQSHYESLSQSSATSVFCRIPPAQRVLEPRRIDFHRSLRYLLSYSAVSATASAQTLLLSACITEQLAWETRSPEQIAAFLSEALSSKVVALNQLGFDFMLSEAPSALGLLHRYMLLSEELLPPGALRDSPWGPLPQGQDAMALQGYQALYTVSVLLDHFQVDWWVTHGSLLGALRNGGIIPHDSDIDVAISHEQLSTLVSTTFKQALALNDLSLTYDPPQGRFQIVSQPRQPMSQTPGYSLPGQMAPEAGTYLDLWLFGADSTGKVMIVDRPYYKPHQRLTLLWDELHPEDTVRRLLFGEVEVRVPGGAELFLDQLYGEDWRTLVRHQETVQPFTPPGSGAVGPMKGPTGPLNRVVKLTTGTWVSGSPPMGLFDRAIVTTA